MQPTILSCTDTDFAPTAAQLLGDRMRSAIAERGKCVLGLSGGSTPRPVYTLLAEQPDIDWSRVILFLVDDRYVPADDPRSNQFLLRSTLLQTAPIPESQLLLPDVTLPIHACVEQYDALVGDVLQSGIDLLLLGMGDDGHIASLFPPVPQEAFGDRCVMHTTTNRFDVHDRISVTMRLITVAKQAVFLLNGDAKQRVWDAMLASTENAARWPAKAVLDNVETTVVRA